MPTDSPDLLHPHTSWPACRFGPSRGQVESPERLRTEPDREGRGNPELVCSRPVHHVLDYARLHALARSWKARHPHRELRLWLRSDLGDRASYEDLSFDRVSFLERSSVAGWESPPTGAALLPLDYRVPDVEAESEAAARAFQAALVAESPRWTTAPGMAWPVELPARPRLLIHQARFHIGDVLWLTPLLRALRKRFSDAEVTLVGPPVAHRVLAGNPHVAEIVPYPESGGPAERRRVIETLGERRFDAALFAFARRPESAWLARAAAARCIPTRVNLEYFDAAHDPRRIAPWATQEAWCFWSALASPEMLLHALDPFTDRRLPFTPADRRVEVFVSAGARRRAADALAERGLRDEPFVVLAPGGDSSERWPARNFARLAAWLATELGLSVLIEGAPREEPLLREVLRLAGRPGLEGRRIQVATDPLDRFAAILERARLLVSNDSAPIHFAEAVGTPSLYFAQREKLIHSHPAAASWALFDDAENRLSKISVEQVAGAIREILAQLAEMSVVER